MVTDLTDFLRKVWFKYVFCKKYKYAYLTCLLTEYSSEALPDVQPRITFVNFINF